MKFFKNILSIIALFAIGSMDAKPTGAKAAGYTGGSQPVVSQPVINQQGTPVAAQSERSFKTLLEEVKKMNNVVANGKLTQEFINWVNDNTQEPAFREALLQAGANLKAPFNGNAANDRNLLMALNSQINSEMGGGLQLALSETTTKTPETFPEFYNPQTKLLNESYLESRANQLFSLNKNEEQVISLLNTELTDPMIREWSSSGIKDKAQLARQLKEQIKNIVQKIQLQNKEKRTVIAKKAATEATEDTLFLARSFAENLLEDISVQALKNDIIGKQGIIVSNIFNQIRNNMEGISDLEIISSMNTAIAKKINMKTDITNLIKYSTKPITQRSSQTKQQQSAEMQQQQTQKGQQNAPIIDYMTVINTFLDEKGPDLLPAMSQPSWNQWILDEIVKVRAAAIEASPNANNDEIKDYLATAIIRKCEQQQITLTDANKDKIYTVIGSNKLQKLAREIEAEKAAAVATPAPFTTTFDALDYLEKEVFPWFYSTIKLDIEAERWDLVDSKTNAEIKNIRKRVPESIMRDSTLRMSLNAEIIKLHEKKLNRNLTEEEKNRITSIIDPTTYKAVEERKAAEVEQKKKDDLAAINERAAQREMDAIAERLKLESIKTYSSAAAYLKDKIEKDREAIFNAIQTKKYSTIGDLWHQWLTYLEKTPYAKEYLIGKENAWKPLAQAASLKIADMWEGTNGDNDLDNIKADINAQLGID